MNLESQGHVGGLLGAKVGGDPPPWSPSPRVHRGCRALGTVCIANYGPKNVLGKVSLSLEPTGGDWWVRGLCPRKSAEMPQIRRKTTRKGALRGLRGADMACKNFNSLGKL